MRLFWKNKSEIPFKLNSIMSLIEAGRIYYSFSLPC